MPIEDEGTTNINDDIELLSEGEDTSENDNKGEKTIVHPPAKEVKTEEKTGEETEEKDEEEEVPSEEEEEEEQPEDLDEPIYERPSLKDIKAKYPDFFKDFPSMKHVFFRERELTNIFPTIEEAKDAQIVNTAFNNLQENVSSGDCIALVQSVKELGDSEFNNFTNNLLPALYKVSSDAYYNATKPLMQNMVRWAYSEGTKYSNENIQNAALVIANLIFGDKTGEDVATGKRSVVEQSKEDSKVSKENEELKQQRAQLNLERYINPTVEKGESGLKALVDNDKLDPDNELTTWMRSTLVERIVDEVGKQLKKDQQFLNFMDTLWDRYKNGGYQESDQSRLISAYLARAKKLVTPIRIKLVSEALGRASATGKNKEDKVKSINNRRESTNSGGRSSNKSENNFTDYKKIDWAKTSDMDIIG